MRKKANGSVMIANPKKYILKEDVMNSNKTRQNSGITLIALVITILFSYDEMIKFSNSKGFLLATI